MHVSSPFLFLFCVGAMIKLQLRSFPMRSHRCCNTVDISNSQVTVRQADSAAVTRPCGARSPCSLTLHRQSDRCLPETCEKWLYRDKWTEISLVWVCSETSRSKNTAGTHGNSVKRQPKLVVNCCMGENLQPLHPPAVLCHTEQKKGV